MKKDRNRFDALAEELADPPEPKGVIKVDVTPMEWDDEVTPAPEFNFPPPPQPTARKLLGRPSVSPQARAAAKARTTPTAYLSAMGKMWPVMECNVQSRSQEDQMYRDPYDAQLDRLMSRHVVMIKIAARMNELDRALSDGDPALVIMTGESDPLYYKLERIKTNWTMTASNGSYVEIEAEARQLQ